ncbi:nose resistant to fluoxetine protein 6-like [Amblyomma americanum]
MPSLIPAAKGRGNGPFTAGSLLTTCLLLLLVTQCLCAESTSDISKVHTTTPAMATAVDTIARDDVYFKRVLQEVVAESFIQVPASLKGKLLGANVRPVCKAALRRTFRAFENMEPWALRLFDASGKYPTGLFQLNRVDLGAFDECIETEVRGALGNELSRGQYCSLELSFNNFTTWKRLLTYFSDVIQPRLFDYQDELFYIDTHFVRLGICLLDECSKQDVQALVDSVTPSVITAGVLDCTTAEPQPWDKTQIRVTAFLGLLVVTVIFATLVDLATQSKREHLDKNGLHHGLLTAFSAAANTRTLLHTAEKTDPSHHMQFLHGLRFFAMTHTVLAHTYGILSDVWGNQLIILIGVQEWRSGILTSAFNSVDTMFFLSGFFLCFAVMAQGSSGSLVFGVAVIRRLIRVCIPLFFVIMCFYVLPCIVTGPNSKAFFDKFYVEIAEEWWRLLFQIRNFSEVNIQTMFLHTWSLSVDFQLFVVSLLVILTLKNRKAMALRALGALSLLGCIISAWTVFDSEITPFMTLPGFKASVMLKTLNTFYIRPSYHAVCYFSGCITFLIMDDFRRLKMSKGTQLVGWCVATSCCLCVVFMKAPWYHRPNPASQFVKILATVSDRLLWSLFLAWTTLACSTGRGGFVGRFLSCNVFVPLSKLSCGVYLIHFPLILLMLHASRERLHLSHFTQLTLFFGVLTWSLLLAYLEFLMCEGPIATLDKSAFQIFIRRGKTAQRNLGRQTDTNGAPAEKPENNHVHSE